MSETPFTAADVRAKADANRDDAEHGIEDWREIVAMLDAFAQRLEQDAARAREHVWTPPRTILDIEETWREEGRREVLRKIAEIKYQLNSWLDDGCLIDGQQCAFCAQNAADGPHAPDCLYLRAQEAVKP